MDPAVKEAVLADLRLANAFFDAASRIAGAGVLKREAIQMGHQVLQIAMDRMKGGEV